MTRLTSTRARWCRHFTGIQNVTCKVGVTYADVRDSESSPYRWPCLYDDLSCNSREYRTAEESAAEEAEINALLKIIPTARGRITTALGGEPGATTVACPKCDGKLEGSMASNGHVHARCRTVDCLQWME